MENAFVPLATLEMIASHQDVPRPVLVMEIVSITPAFVTRITLDSIALSEHARVIAQATVTVMMEFVTASQAGQDSNAHF